MIAFGIKIIDVRPMDISQERKQYWVDYIRNAEKSAADEKWLRKTNDSTWAVSRNRQLKKLHKKAKPENTWKIAHLLLIAAAKGENPKKYCRMYDFRLSDHQDARRLHIDFDTASVWSRNIWLNHAIKNHGFNKDAIMEIISSYDDHSVWESTLIRLAEKNDTAKLDFLTECGLLPCGELCEAIHTCTGRNNLIYANRLIPYMPPEEQINLSANPKRERIEKPVQSGWHKVDEYTVSHIRKLPGNIEMQDVFNFYAREVTCITRSLNDEDAHMTQTIRHFDEVAEPREIQRASNALKGFGGNPLSSDCSPKKSGTAIRPPKAGEA